MKTATLKADSCIRIRQEIAEMVGNPFLTTADIEDEFRALENQCETEQSLSVEISIHGKVYGFIHATEQDFEIEYFDELI